MTADIPSVILLHFIHHRMPIKLIRTAVGLGSSQLAYNQKFEDARIFLKDKPARLVQFLPRF